ncbi:hypothetical protein ITJ64_01875 [Herbiconiux sp. VKM Ac-1786]|uniref:hypothetical protein n=1 Tax=Herbiconiux sp. VKM Ac-1786 TaxID=2783824 RepID=UPI00188B50A9|nr:hypothetical protein [Herbiconiux sp. VKM Ac-1786]MBF4571258.1 hypothetical protein [Herbiconiux sp. VKM Ac-1786]
MAFIERIEVEHEGFLADFDVSLDPALNVLIGARGTGKTSVIELIRYALDAGSFTTDAGTKGEQQAVATLDGGAVTLTLREGDERWTLTRTAEGVTSSGTVSPACTVLAQSEIESIGVSPDGRIALLDRFLPTARDTAAEILAAGALAASLTDEIASGLAELDKANESLSGATAVDTQLGEARGAQEALLSSSTATLADQEALTGAQTRLAELARRENALLYARESVVELSARASETRDRAVEVAESIANTVSETASAERVNRARLLLEQAAVQFEEAVSALTREAQTVVGHRAELDASSRALRQRLDSAQDGLSQATRRVQQLEEIKGQLDALHARRSEFVRRLDLTKQRRRASYESLSAKRADRLTSRQGVAELLNAQLGPQIRVKVSAGERLESYISAIVASLRGSGLHYNNLAPSLATSVAPFELVEWTETGAFEDLARATGLPADRASSVLAALKQGGVGAIVAIDVEDDVSLELLDGPEYKPIQHLSIGQRCTVVLPILLALPNTVLVVDQPEDHLDNAFIVSTLIAAVRERRGSAQTIFSSHNANIPVLGDAARVILMDSDGERGRAAASGSLEDSPIVSAISELMEGGRAAFETRAQFYGLGGAAR